MGFGIAVWLGFVWVDVLRIYGYSMVVRVFRFVDWLRLGWVLWTIDLLY